jgi:hypothetical protein
MNFTTMSGEMLLLTRIFKPEYAHQIDAEIERRARQGVAKAA